MYSFCFFPPSRGILLYRFTGSSPSRRCKISPSYRYLLLLTCLLVVILSTGCTANKTPEKAQDLDFTIVSGTDVPGDLKELINQRRKEAFQLTYTEGSFLYIARGYGKQKGGDYNIVINNFYLADECIVFDTELFGPKADEAVSDKPSYPYIIIKTEYREQPVVFP